MAFLFYGANGGHMINPGKEQFLKMAKPGTVLPLFVEILADMETPVSAFRKVRSGRYDYLLESVEAGVQVGRFSFIGTDPKMVFRCTGKKISIEKDGRHEERESSNPLQILESEVRKYTPLEIPGLDVPFWGGAVGFVGYEQVRLFEALPDKGKKRTGAPDLYFTMMKNILAFDQLKHKIYIIHNAFIDKDPELVYKEGFDAISQTLEKFRKPVVEEKSITFMGQKDDKFYALTRREDYCKSVEKVKEHIRAGDIFQCVLSQRFTTSANVDPFNVYRALRTVNPSPYMFYLAYPEMTMAGSSPEVMVRKERDDVMVRPIAGTRPRGSNPQEDAMREADLLSDEKEKAEHLMLVDLGRNDLGRICEKGSVHVDKFMFIERYSHVMHIVSTVRGKLEPGLGLDNLVKAVFPAGTVSGAPKIRAMEIIEELEPLRRETYAGLVGYYAFNGNFDSCITIRTIIQKEDQFLIQAGAGLVADSIPEKEHEECVNKAKALFRAIELARGGLQ